MKEKATSAISLAVFLLLVTGCGVLHIAQNLPTHIALASTSDIGSCASPLEEEIEVRLADVGTTNFQSPSIVSCADNRTFPVIVSNSEMYLLVWFKRPSPDDNVHIAASADGVSWILDPDPIISIHGNSRFGGLEPPSVTYFPTLNTWFVGRLATVFDSVAGSADLSMPRPAIEIATLDIPKDFATISANNDVVINPALNQTVIESDGDLGSVKGTHEFVTFLDGATELGLDLEVFLRPGIFRNAPWDLSYLNNELVLAVWDKTSCPTSHPDVICTGTVKIFKSPDGETWTAAPGLDAVANGLPIVADDLGLDITNSLGTLLMSVVRQVIRPAPFFTQLAMIEVYSSTDATNWTLQKTVSVQQPFLQGLGVQGQPLFKRPSVAGTVSDLYVAITGPTSSTSTPPATHIYLDPTTSPEVVFTQDRDTIGMTLGR